MGNPVIANGYGLDRAVAALFCGAKAGETVSVMMARGAQAGRRGPCLACRFLAWAVERDHCAKVLTNAPQDKSAVLRAGAWLFGGAFAVWLVPLGIWWMF